MAVTILASYLLPRFGTEDEQQRVYLNSLFSNIRSILTQGVAPTGAAGGDLTGTYPNPTITGHAVTNPKLAQMNANSLKGNNTGGVADARDLDASSVNTMLGTITNSTSAGGDLTGTYPNPTVGTNKITNAKLAQAVSLSIKGNATNAAANVTDIQTAAGGNGVLIESSSALIFSKISAANINTSAVTNSILATMPANTIKGNNTAGVANPVDLTVAQTNTLLGTVTTLAAVGAVPNANAASIASNTLNLQPANGSFPGVVTTAAQTFAGDKTFSGDVIPSARIKWLTGSAFPAVLSVNGQAFDYVSGGNGRVIYGCGSSYDVLIANRGGATVLGVVAATQTAQFGGDVDIATVGNGLRVAEGANAKQGTAVLVAGTKVVSNTAVTANSRIFLTSQVDGGTPGFLRVSTRTAGTSFTILSSNAADTSTVAYEIFEPG